MDVQKAEMKNGLVIASEIMPHLRSVSLGVWVKCGSRFEKEEKTGISHFIEHLLFKGTTTRSAATIAEAIDSVGGQLNAFTEKEYVGFYAKVLDEHLPFAFELVSDIVLNPVFPVNEIQRERNVIFEEINMVEDSPQELILDMYLENFWKDHPLGRPISGTKKSVARIARADVKKFFKRNYTARNMVIAVAGNIRHGNVRQLARRYFSELEPGVALEPGRPPDVHAGRRVRHKAHLEQTHICLGTVSPPVASEERYAAHLLCNILGGGMSSRLFQNIRERRGLVYSIYSMLNLYQDAGALVVYAGTAPDKAAQVVELTLKEFGKMRSQLVSADELKRAKENIKGSVMLGLESSSSRMTHLAQQLIYYSRFYELEEILGGVERVSARAIRELANRIFEESYLTLTALSSRNGSGLHSVALEM
ncbi:MAG: peptidase domain protein [Acidobacteria bacterium]|nr:peptidase domain protein [Acidobacteriota bacterium]